MLIQAIRSHIHFSQLSAWLSRSKGSIPSHVTYRLVHEFTKQIQLKSIKIDDSNITQNNSWTPNITCKTYRNVRERKPLSQAGGLFADSLCSHWTCYLLA